MLLSNHDMVERVSKKANSTLGDTEEVIDSIFRIVRKEIESGDFKVMNIKGLLKFQPNVTGLKTKLLKLKENDSGV